MEQSLSLLELFDILNDVLRIKLEYTQIPPRQSDQKVFVADISKIKNKLGWMPQISARDGIAEMINWVSELKCDASI